MEEQTCPECERSFYKVDLSWVCDRYGIPYRKVCYKCHDKVRAQICEWVFDPADAGESLDPI